MKKNKKISLSLSKSVISKLEAKHVKGGQFGTATYGVDDPLADCASDVGCGPSLRRCPIG